MPPQPHILRQAQSFVAKVASEGGGGGGGGENGTFVVALHVRNGRDFRSKKLTDAEWGRLADCAGALPTARKWTVRLHLRPGQRVVEACELRVTRYELRF